MFAWIYRIFRPVKKTPAHVAVMIECECGCGISYPSDQMVVRHNYNSKDYPTEFIYRLHSSTIYKD